MRGYLSGECVEWRTLPITVRLGLKRLIEDFRQALYRRALFDLPYLAIDNGKHNGREGRGEEKSERFKRDTNNFRVREEHCVQHSSNEAHYASDGAENGHCCHKDPEDFQSVILRQCCAAFDALYCP